MFSFVIGASGWLRVVLIDKLREAQRAGHPRRPSADDDNIGLHLRAVDAFKGFAKSDHRRLDRIQGSASRVSVHSEASKNRSDLECPQINNQFAGHEVMKQIMRE